MLLHIRFNEYGISEDVPIIEQELLTINDLLKYIINISDMFIDKNICNYYIENYNKEDLLREVLNEDDFLTIKLSPLRTTIQSLEDEYEIVYDKYKPALINKLIPYMNEESETSILEKLKILADDNEWVGFYTVVTLAKYHPDRLRKYVNLGGNVCYKNQCGDNVLMIVTDLETTQLLIELGCNINHINDEGKTPIFYAIESKNWELINFYINNGANINHIDNNGILVRSILQ